jgi:hypothetical protein
MLEIAKIRQSELLEEAARERLLRQARATRHSLLDRALAGIGDFLISLGQELQEMAHGPKACLSKC